MLTFNPHGVLVQRVCLVDFKTLAGNVLVGITRLSLITGIGESTVKITTRSVMWLTILGSLPVDY